MFFRISAFFCRVRMENLKFCGAHDVDEMKQDSIFKYNDILSHFFSIYSWPSLHRLLLKMGWVALFLHVHHLVTHAILLLSKDEQHVPPNDTYCLRNRKIRINFKIIYMFQLRIYFIVMRFDEPSCMGCKRCSAGTLRRCSSLAVDGNGKD